jgi:alanyl-tRNA synthetase
MAQSEFDIYFFRDNDFTRKQCIVCSSYFWTKNTEKKTCGDPACESYSFIGNSPVYRPYSLDEMRVEFLKFFKNDELEHMILYPYPVVPRWRDDVLLVNASIYDFQPQVTSGLVPPPGNPITMSQPSIRMLDLDLVGKTGRHLTSFEMLCHDAFNYENKYIYWKNETIEYSYRFLTEKLRVKSDIITYKEKPWFGGGNAGNAVEVFVRGLEVATLVFMDMKEDPDGDIDIEGTKYFPMPLKIVDTGYGLERLVWLSTGTPTVYESIFGDTIEYIRKNASVGDIDPAIMQKLSELSAEIDPYSESKLLNQVAPYMKKNNIDIDDEFLNRLKKVRSVYSLADHTKTLLLMFSDYVIPSNVKVGYLARALIRRSLKFMDEIGFSKDFMDLMEFQHNKFSGIIKNYDREFIRNIISLEKEKYDEINKTAETKVKKYIRSGRLKFSDAITLYESEGLNEDLIVETYKKITGKDIELPDNFQETVISGHETKQKKKKEIFEYPPIHTRPLYYDNAKISEFTGIVLYSGDKRIITNQTAFYPEGGGQPCDLGYFMANGKRVNVTDVQKYNDSIVHFLDGDIPANFRVKGFIDYNRRKQLMIHHSATHLILGMMRKYLGDHIWQSGVKKDVGESRIDVTHYGKITPEDVRKIENMCLEAIEQDRKITIANISWNPAIEKYGFRLFEGGVPVSSKIRVVTIDGIDSEGCGGTHLDSTGQIGFIKIMRTETIQEGIQRIIFSAGPAAMRYVQLLHDTVLMEQEYMKVDVKDVYSHSLEIFHENLENRKLVDRYRKEKIEGILNGNYTVAGNISIYETNLGREELNLLIQSIFRKNIKAAIINNETAITAIGIDRYIDSLVSELSRRGVKIEEKARNKKLYTAICSFGMSEKLIREILVAAIV